MDLKSSFLIRITSKTEKEITISPLDKKLNIIEGKEVTMKVSKESSEQLKEGVNYDFRTYVDRKGETQYMLKEVKLKEDGK